MMDPNEQDAHRRERLEGDDLPAALTSFQASKCAQIIGAYVDGHDGWAPHVRTVVNFLSAAAVEGAGKAIVRPGTAELWPTINELPWPASGKPRTQPDLP